MGCCFVVFGCFGLVLCATCWGICGVGYGRFWGCVCGAFTFGQSGGSRVLLGSNLEGLVKDYPVLLRRNTTQVNLPTPYQLLRLRFPLGGRSLDWHSVSRGRSCLV